MNQIDIQLSLETIRQYRAVTFNSIPGKSLKSLEEALNFTNQRKFILFWPSKGIAFPSLWVAAAGDRPVPDEHDDPGHVTWNWKDGMLGKRKWFYSRVLASKNTIISNEALPYFYALSPNYGEPETDYLVEYEQGRMSMESKMVYEALLDKGPLDTLQLRKAARLSSPENSSRFNRALTELQTRFRIMPTGISDSGAWHYSFIYDLVPHHLPDLIDQCRFISDAHARKFILTHLMISVGAIQIGDIRKLLGWNLETCKVTLDLLLQEGYLFTIESIQNSTGQPTYRPNQKTTNGLDRWYVLSSLVKI